MSKVLVVLFWKAYTACRVLSGNKLVTICNQLEALPRLAENRGGGWMIDDEGLMMRD